MKTRTINSLLIAFLFLATSCEKVIDVKVDAADKKYVVEGILTNQTGQCMVLLSQTKNLGDDNTFAGVAGATVTITDNGGTTTTLSATSTGVYAAPALTGTPGSTYRLNIQINGETFTASSTMPPPVNMDSVYTTEDNLFGDTRKLVNVVYKDPAGVRNYYRFVQYRNGIKEKTIFVDEDELTDGNKITNKLRYFTDDDEDNIKTGDNIQVDMLCIDAAVYKYWYSFDQGATGDSQTATPANPVTNIKGGALGYFSAHTLQRKIITAP